MATDWIDKRDNHKYPSIRKMTEKGMMYISTPEEIDLYLKTLPKGKIITKKDIAEHFSKEQRVDFTCPLTTGIFVSICANAAEQELARGKKLDEVTPYWRVVKEKGRLYDKYLGQPSKQKEYLEKEGHKVRPAKVKAARFELDL